MRPSGHSLAKPRRKPGGQFADVVYPLSLALALLLAWETLVAWLGIAEYILPRPSRIVTEITATFPALFRDSWVTGVEAVLGFLLANVVSMVLAVSFVHARPVERALYPYVIALKSVPVVAVAPLLVLWFGYGMSSKVVMAAVIAFFPLVVNATTGLRQVEPELLELFHSRAATPTQILLHLRLPNAVPYLFAALKVSAALAVVGAIVAELTGATQGLGFRVLIASYNIDTPMLFAAITAASLVGIAFFGLVVIAESHFLRWQPRRDVVV